MKKLNSVGVIVARFQVPQLHMGHQYLIQSVRDKHHRVMIVLGLSPVRSDRNPLSVEMRKAMIESEFPQEKFTIVSSESLPLSGPARSKLLDELIIKYFPNQEAVIYGSRDSVLLNYTGVFAVTEIPTVYDGNATLIRQSVPEINSADFRKGVVHAYNNRKSIFYPTVDVAILGRNDSVLLISKKNDEGQFRFPGVFFKEDDLCYENSAIRCVHKEVPGVEVQSVRLIASSLVRDWRFAKTKDGIVTILTSCNWSKGNAEPGPGTDKVGWFTLSAADDMLIEMHKPLLDLLVDRM